MATTAYALALDDGMTPVGAWQASAFNPESGVFPWDDGRVERVATLADARATFIRYARDIMRDDVPTDDGGPSALLYRVSADADGIEPDSDPIAQLIIGPRWGFAVIGL